MILIKKLQKKNPNRKTLVVVPTIQLKQQWEAELKQFNIGNTEVLVINTVVLQKVTKRVDFLILDEIHRFAANEFVKVFTLIQYRFILGLTATIQRLDGKDSILVSHAPVIDTISLSEARVNGWISDYIEYNYGINMSPSDEAAYEKLTTAYQKYFKLFGFDFELAMKCQAGKAKTPGGVDGPASRELYATVMGWDPIRDRNDKTHPWHPDNIAGYAMKFGKYMRLRKEYLYNAQCKVDAAIDLINHFSGKKVITFSESTSFADRVTASVPGSVSYHSYIPGETIEVEKEKIYKTESSAIKFYKKNASTLNSLKRKGVKLTWKKSVKISPNETRREILRKFSDNRYNLQVINTAKALDQGTDVEDIEVALIFSRTSNPTQQTQRVGRSARKFKFASGKDKIAVVVNIYIINTQDEKWLSKAQSKYKTPVNWITSLNEISLGRVFNHNGVIDVEEPE